MGIEVQAMGQVGRQFCGKHLVSAAMFSRMCGEYEAKHINDKDNGVTVHLPIQFAYVSASVLLSVAFAEAHANELLFRPAEAFPGKSEDEACSLAEEYKWKQTIPKYQAILGSMDKELLPEDCGIVQSMQVLIDLRNALTHPRTLWVTAETDYSQGKEGATQGLVSPLRGKFKLNPFIPKRRRDLYSYISYGCAKWAVQTARQFVEQFREKADLLPFDFEKPGEQIDPCHGAERS